MSFKLNIGQKRLLQLISSDAIEILCASGSRSGKTFLFILAQVLLAVKFPNSRHLIARKHFAHVKLSVWRDTLPKVIQICFPNIKPTLVWNNTDYFLKFSNGSEIWMAGLDDKERIDKILGREYMTIFFNECSEISYDAYTTVKSRLAQRCTIERDGVEIVGKNKIFLDENPTSAKHWSKILFLDKKEPSENKPVQDPNRYAFTFIHPSENVENISPEYLNELNSLPLAKRKRFLDGEFSDGSTYALWSVDGIAKARVQVAPPMKRIVVAIDPAVTSKEDSDETGIIVRGIDYNNHLYSIADYTGKYTPIEWATIAIKAYNDHKADMIVGEVNNGGDMIETIIRQVDKYVPYTSVRATRDKQTRAEPVAALTNTNPPTDHIVGELPDLELERTNWEGRKGDKSPNRIDADVWGAVYLMPNLDASKQFTGSFFGDFDFDL